MFKKIRENWQKKIERNSIKSTLTYVNKKGIVFMKQGVKFEDLPSETKVTEEVIIRRSLLPLGDWARIYPPIKENGKLNLTNLIFGGWRNLVKLILILIIVGLIFMQFADNFAMIDHYRELAENCVNIII